MFLKLINEFDKTRILENFGEEFDMRNLTYVKEVGDIVVTIYLDAICGVGKS